MAGRPFGSAQATPEASRGRFNHCTVGSLRVLACTPRGIGNQANVGRKRLSVAKMKRKEKLLESYYIVVGMSEIWHEAGKRKLAWCGEP